MEQRAELHASKKKRLINLDLCILIQKSRRKRLPCFGTDDNLI